MLINKKNYTFTIGKNEMTGGLGHLCAYICYAEPGGW